MRHSFATHLLAGGTDVHTTMQCVYVREQSGTGDGVTSRSTPCPQAQRRRPATSPTAAQRREAQRIPPAPL
ncbi:MAG: hypothetical protein ABEL04_12500 [Salinibacter sp.]|uniref:hypothetical protein n=1 Tax=Salinibacter sp. TaxID=2065818 RepID=UPI0035D4F156